MAINLDRKSPGIVGIVFGAFSAIALGALLGCFHLASKPVQVVSTLPNEPVAGTRYFVQGAAGSGSTWERKLERLKTASGEFGLTEADLNGWATAGFAEAKVEDAESIPVMIVAGKPNFRIQGTELQVGAINRVLFFGSPSPLVLQAKGGFEREGSKWVFAPKESFLGGLALHRVPALQSLVAGRFGAKDALPEDVKNLLARATQISVVNGEVLLRMP